jgi:parvulin-like peptidyl-prolyl isomerase
MIRRAACIAIAVLAVTAPSSAEVIEEIVAWVDGDIITKSELEEEERLLTEELYRQFTGEELDAQLAAARAQLLPQLIDRKILMHRAERLFDLDTLGGNLVDDFRRRNGIETDDQLTQMLAREGMTLDDLKRRLLENTAPNEIVRIEVQNRVSVSDAEVETFYAENPDLFRVPAEFLIREIVILADDTNREDKQEKAQQLYEQASAPEAEFAALAREHSEAGTASSGGLLGPVGKGDLSEHLERAAMTTPVGDVAELMELPYGFHLVKVESRTEESVRPLAEVRDTVRQNLENRKFVETLQEFLARAREESEWRVNEAYLDRAQNL